MESATGTDDPAGKIHQHTLTEWQPAQMLFKYSYFFLNEKQQVEPQVRIAPAKVGWHRISETIEGAIWIWFANPVDTFLQEDCHCSRCRPRLGGARVKVGDVKSSADGC